MIIHRALLAVLPLALSSPAPAAVTGWYQDDLGEDIAAYADAASGWSLDEIWNEAQNVAFVLGDEHGAPFDAAIDKALRAGEASGKGVLWLCATRMLGEDVDWELIAAAIEPLLEGRDQEVLTGSAALIQSSELDRQDGDLREDMTDLLLGVAGDNALPATVRADCAVSAHQIGLGHQIPKARKVLYDFLSSSDAGLRARGALGMAGLGIIDGIPEVESELERLAGLPGENGRLAAAYLKQQQIRRFKDTELRLARQHAEKLTSGGAVSPDLQRLEQLISMVQQYHMEGRRVKREDLLDAAMNGLLQSLDRHSSYFSPDAYKKFEQQLEAEYGGIGAYVGTDPDDGLFTITRPIYSGPAYEAGLSSDDKIIRVDDWPTIGEDDQEVIKRLKGRPGTKIKIYVWRRGMDPALIDRPTEDMAIEIERAAITIPPVSSIMLPGDIALIELTTFSRVASTEVGKAIETSLDSGARGIILDLRNNTGGLLTEARNVSGLFLPKGTPVVSTESTISQGRTHKTLYRPVVPEDMPVIVLVNRHSASASEIVSGALQDHDRAVIVGQRSFGKGSVQQLIPLDIENQDRWADENGNRRFDEWEKITVDHDGDGEFDYSPRIKMTVERYRLPTGRSIHREFNDEGEVTSEGGIAPDVEVGPTRREQWRITEMRRLMDSREVRNWARDQYEQHKETYEALAEGDDDEFARYPNFDGLYESLDTVLSKNDVRYILRNEVRRLVQDSRGEAFPYGSDYQEDVQLQAAITQILEHLGQGTDALASYAKTFDEVGEDGILISPDGPGKR